MMGNFQRVLMLASRRRFKVSHWGGGGGVGLWVNWGQDFYGELFRAREKPHQKSRFGLGLRSRREFKHGEPLVSKIRPGGFCLWKHRCSTQETRSNIIRCKFPKFKLQNQLACPRQAVLTLGVMEFWFASRPTHPSD